MKSSLLSDGLKAALFSALVMMSSLTHAEDKTVVGLITHLIIGNAGDPTAPVMGIAIKPVLQECLYGIMFASNTGSGYGKMVTSAAIAAQAGNNAVSITYDNADGCKIKQFVVLTL